ncbi:hypothetical protein C2857_002402 [Epichloe festucae Fl1]|uniref:Uncharacterized protein n=1 Tax=Epichloe festucae (strain Fl1) TaxID=877507 RepID=A0A7S9KUW3_EPIFF|nr:hypothetical protein C2857_002402 [Epichloe festucae Fl1]
MYYKKFIIAFLGVVRAAPHGSGPSVDAAIGIPGAFEVPVEWEHEAFMDGPLPTLNGTVQDVYRRLLEMNADYDAHLHLDALNIRRTELGARVDFSNARVYCDRKTFGSASVDGLSQGIDHLRGLGGRARSGGGPGACGRVSCSYGTGIWWCNDSKDAKTLEGWGSIADGAQKVWTSCAGRLDDGFHAGKVSGQAFHWTGWSVIVRQNDC